MLDELIARYGEGAILTVSPYVLDSGETLRWIVEIDGKDLPDTDVRVQEHAGRPDVVVMSLVHGDEEIEIQHWSRKRYPHGPSALVCRLRDLR
jgi:hypothetical protein